MCLRILLFLLVIITDVSSYNTTFAAVIWLDVNKNKGALKQILEEVQLRVITCSFSGIIVTESKAYDILVRSFGGGI